VIVVTLTDSDSIEIGFWAEKGLRQIFGNRNLILENSELLVAFFRSTKLGAKGNLSENGLIL